MNKRKNGSLGLKRPNDGRARRKGFEMKCWKVKRTRPMCTGSSGKSSSNGTSGIAMRNQVLALGLPDVSPAFLKRPREKCATEDKPVSPESSFRRDIVGLSFLSFTLWWLLSRSKRVCNFKLSFSWFIFSLHKPVVLYKMLRFEA